MTAAEGVLAVGLLACLAGGLAGAPAAAEGAVVSRTVLRVVRRCIGTEDFPAVTGTITLDVRGEQESLRIRLTGLPPNTRFRVILSPGPEPRRIPAAFLGSFVSDRRGRGRFTLVTQGGGLTRAFVVCDTDRNRKDFIGDPIPEPREFLAFVKVFPAKHGDKQTTFGPLVCRADGPLVEPDP